MKLSEAILAGCQIAPIKCKHRFIGVDGSADILGAAALATGFRPSSGSCIHEHLEKTFPSAHESPGPGSYWVKSLCEAMERCKNTEESRESIAARLAEQGL